MRWQLLVVKKALVGWLPFGDSLRSAKRMLLGYVPDRGNLRQTLAHFEQMHSELRANQVNLNNATVLEIGTGWFPVVPLSLLIDGASKVIMTDLNPHLDVVTFKATMEFLASEQPHRFAVLTGCKMSDLALDYQAPFDPRQLSDSSIDIVMSRTVLEHISTPALVELLSALRKKLRPGGVMIHLVDHSDHLEHQDKTISKINFLTWTDRRHKVINRLIGEGENRLRHHEYAKVFEQSGLQVIKSCASLHEPTRQLAKSLSLAGRFASMTPEQVSILSSIYLLRAS